MGLLSFLRRWTTSSSQLDLSPPPAPEVTLERAAPAMTVAPAMDELSDSAEPPGWWVPRVCDPAAARPAGTVDQTLYSRLVAVLDNPNIELPRLPQVTQQLLARMQSEDVDYKKAAELARQDPVLTANLLRLVNSVAYRGVAEVTQIDRAFARLGRRALCSFLIADGVKGIAIKVGGKQKSLGEELWRRSLASAVMMGFAAQRFGLSEDQSFLVGLLHDIGSLAILKVLYDHRVSGGAETSRATFDRVNREWHEHLGMRLADAWGLPDPLPELIGSHHREPRDDDPLKTTRYLLAMCDAAGEMLGYAAYVGHDFLNLACVKKLGLRDEPSTRTLLLEMAQAAETRMAAF
ncbi:HDOD domain protein [Phycisphaerae bacterium RAS1]|nr:HDOD domain protein [Phycisphaerae bacterium RAS1]